ncbi:hypothetical protein F4861DRAFT_122019 [Xylaria intraflava]|nr:hypothetical protein F4861DRAFT_122019 [Xylaria intraflava]
MSSRKNTDIRSFFKPGPPSSQTQDPPSSLPSSVLDLPSSPITPAKSSSRVFSRDDEIKGSDDSDDDSDDSLGSITEALGFRARPAAHRHDPSIQATPQAKRLASGIHRSPLTLQPKKHKFDMKALISHSREFERTEQSAKEAEALIAQAEKISDDSDDSGAENDAKRIEGVACQLFAGGTAEEDGKGDKLRRAFKRSTDDEASLRKHCYFFSHEEPFRSGTNTFPRKVITGHWKCLAQSEARRRAFIMGLPYTFIAQGEALPDELFLWILNEISTEQDAELRRQYINLTELCEDNTRRLINDMRLYALVEGMGGPRYAREHSKFVSSTEVRREYLERNWSPLVAFLQLLDRLAPSLQTASAISAVQLLLRMSLDPVVAAVVREHHTRAMTMLISKLARSRLRWNTACEAICSYIYENIEDLELKVTAILSIPSSSSYLVDLRRRIAAESLFSSPGLASKPIDPQLSFEKIINRLDEQDFKSTHRTDFEFEQLRALTILLDIVIDSAAFMRPDTNSNDAETPTRNTQIRGTADAEARAAAAAEQKFNTEIDTLANRVKVIHDKIRDKSSRKNLKLCLLGLEKRLRYAVRTQPPRKDIFTTEIMGREPDVNVPKQRDFMRQWALKKKAAKEAREDKALDNPEPADGEQERVADSLQTAIV